MGEPIDIERAGKALIDAVSAPAKVLLLPSPPARAEGHDEDRRFVVVVPRVESRFDEAARLDKLLGRLLIPADVIVVSSEEAQRPQAPGSLIHEALTHGRTVAES